MNHRQIVLDTETTGLDPKEGHKIIEIGCVEIINRRISKTTFHTYLNPLRPIDEEAQKVHGISSDFLKDKPLFETVSDDLLNFIQGADLIIHNAPFDLSFLNHEYRLNKKYGPDFSLDKICSIIDTLVMAKKLHASQKNNLDALCKRYDIRYTHRNLHGGLVDADLLAKVYLAMTSGQDSLFDFNLDKKISYNKNQTEIHELNTERKNLKKYNLFLLKANEEENTSHKTYFENR